MSPSTATLGKRGAYTVFESNGTTVRFLAPYSLERYLEVRDWGDGYLVVLAKYAHSDAPEEEYVDLAPILEDLYLDAEEFLGPITDVRIAHD